MPRTLRRRTLAPNQWISMADLMAEYIRLVAEQRCIKEPLAGLPPRLYKQALAFLSDALAGSKARHFALHGANRGPYRLVEESVRGAFPRSATLGQGVVEKLGEYKQLLERFGKPGPLSDEEVAAAYRTRDFFVRLSRESEVEILRNDARAHISALSRRH